MCVPRLCGSGYTFLLPIPQAVRGAYTAIPHAIRFVVNTATQLLYRPTEPLYQLLEPKFIHTRLFNQPIKKCTYQ